MNQNAFLQAIIGLGNKGSSYTKTYHNVGSFAVANFKEHYGASQPRLIFAYELDTFMNMSGEVVQKLLRKKGIKPEHIIIAHDDSDLPLGGYKVALGGGSAGHKGIQSVIDALGTDQFWRLRIGVRDPHETIRAKADEFVLKKWSTADEQLFISVLEKAWAELRSKKLVAME